MNRGGEEMEQQRTHCSKLGESVESVHYSSQAAFHASRFKGGRKSAPIRHTSQSPCVDDFLRQLFLRRLTSVETHGGAGVRVDEHAYVVVAEHYGGGGLHSACTPRSPFSDAVESYGRARSPAALSPAVLSTPAAAGTRPNLYFSETASGGKRA